ncbi:MAG: sensor histidine kinase, partial [Nitrospirota bacterium]
FMRLLYVSAIILIANLNALVDLVLHPDIPYFDTEHLTVGGISAMVCSAMLYILFNYMNRLKKTLRKHEEAEKQISIYQKQVQSLISQLTIIEERERKNISEKLHDNIGQYLAISMIKLRKLQKSYSPIEKEIDEIRNMLEQTIEFTRSLTYELSSPILYQLGLEEAIEWLVEQIQGKYGIAIDVASDGTLKRFKGETSIPLYNTVRELLLNVIKHSQARKVSVSISNKGDNIRINIKDNGVGFNISESEAYSVENKKFGIFSVRERIRSIGGTIEIMSETGHGTEVSISVPITEKCAAL